MRGGSLLRCVSALISASLMAVFCAEAALEHAVYWIGVVGFAAVGYRYIRHIREYSAD